MSIAQNKVLVAAFLKAFSNGNVPGVFDLMDDVVIWRVMGPSGERAFSVEMNKKGVASLMNTIADVFPNGINLTSTKMIAEDDRVAAEVVSHGVMADGTIYKNYNLFMFDFSDHLITSVREYMDTLHAKSILIDD